MSDFIDSLNERQRRAVLHENGGALVLAGAGTGKTRVLVSRVAWLIEHRACPPYAVLAVTFTNKAAKEMRRRVAEIARFPRGNFAPGTFHGVCHRMLRIHAAAAGWDENFQILDSSDQKTFVRRLLVENGFSADEFSPADCARYINDAKDRGLRANNIAAREERGGAKSAAMSEIYAMYEAACRRENKLDFAELLLSAIDLLRSNGDLRERYAARFRHVLIDEFQDTSPLQYQWLRLLDSGDNCYFAVGDDDQSIYAFRGADPENMRRISSDLRAREIIRLEQNYRSTGNILSAANALIARNTSRLGKTLFTEDGEGAPIVVRRAAADLDEAADIAGAVRAKISAGARADDVAVLYRTNAQSRLLERAMMERGLPYRIYGGTRFFDRMEIKHALAYLRLAVADDRDALLRVINFPPRGIGKKTIENLTASDNLFSESAALPPRASSFYGILRKLRAMREASSLTELARAAVEDSGLLSHYESRAHEEERAANLREFVSAAALFEKDNDGEDAASAFLANAALESGESQGADGDAVNLLTAHAAKGLEFAVVHVAGLEEGIFPYARSLDSANPAAVEEERRLMYVAVTRAREELFLHFADSRMLFGRTETRPHSRFLDELPPAILSGDATYLPGSARAASHSPPARNCAKPSDRPISADAAGARAESKSDDGPRRTEFRPGVIVRHPKYGDGVVLRRNGDGADLEVTVAFKKIGNKTFKAAIAPLALR